MEKMNCVRVTAATAAVAIVLSLLLTCDAQQSYVSNRQLDCYKRFNVTDGFVCNGASRSCLSYLTFRPIHPYDTPTAIAHLLSTDAASIAAANNFSSEFDAISVNVPMVVVPVNCSCSRGHQVHEASYSLQTPTETYFSVANNTYQGLTTCQALMAANPSHDSRNLSAGLLLRVPLRCACPTPAQVAAGVRFLLSYLVTWDDDIPSISRLFGVNDPQSVRDANSLSPTAIIYPFTDLLLPLEAPPPPNWLSLGRGNGGGAPPPAPPPPTTQSPTPPKPSSKKWIAVGVAIGGAALLLISATLFFFFFIIRRRRSKPPPPPPIYRPPSSKKAANSGYETQFSTDTSSFSVSSLGIRSAIDSLTNYTISELRDATDSFDESRRIAGSVFRGSFKGDTAAVKVMKGDISAEIAILKQLNHSNIVRLSGFCLHGGNTYLVYEYTESGSLADRLTKTQQGGARLGWALRVEIAHGLADALNYLHNFTRPPYVHANVKSSNVLLDADFRAKLSNFKLARSLDPHSEAGGGLHLTRHVVGTQGYLAPEYIENGLLTPKLDVFAFGVVLVELLSGKEAAAAATKKDAGELLSDAIRRILQGDDVRQKLREFMDPMLEDKYPLDLAFSTAQLAEACVSPDLNARPDMSQVFMTLSKIRSSTSDWDPSDDLDRTSSLAHGR